MARGKAADAPSDVPPLPPPLRAEVTIEVGSATIVSNLCRAVASFLKAQPNLGCFPNGNDNDLSAFEASAHVFTKFETRRALYLAAEKDDVLVAAYEQLVKEVVLPELSRRLIAASNDISARSSISYWYQCPPTVRVQPPDASTHGGGGGPEHRDADYGHQPGELNFWMPLTKPTATQSTLLVESAPDVGDFHPLDVRVGQLASFHGALCRHRAPANASRSTRVSIDFRIGIVPYFDPHWQMPGVRAQHTRREWRVEIGGSSAAALPAVAAPAAEPVSAAATAEPVGAAARMHSSSACDEAAPPTEAEVAMATRILKRLTPKSLDEHPELLAVGSALFQRVAVTQAFGTPDVKAFLQRQSAHRQMLKDLKRLHAHIQSEHAAAKARAASCGINAARWETLELIKAECVAMEHEALTDGVCRLTAPVSFDRAAASREMLDRCADDAEECRARVEGAAVAAEAAAETGVAAEEAELEALEGGVREVLAKPPPKRGDFTTQCNVCRGEYLATERHDFYHQLCPRCAAFNWEKRQQTADLDGQVAIVTGGRVRIGYATVLKLLRAGAYVLTTTRYPHDAAQRYAREADFDTWRSRLEIAGPLELANMVQVERFCEMVHARFEKVHILINNAAQTLTRARGWFVRQQQLEDRAAASLTGAGRALLGSANSALLEEATPVPALPPPSLAQRGSGTPTPSCGDAVTTSSDSSGCGASGGAVTATADGGTPNARLELASMRDFPPNQLDESRQPLDLSEINSWSRRLGEVPTLEMLQTLAANAAAPFVLVTRLAPLLAARPGEPCGHIVNVSAVEGKFSVPKKSTVHPHTNMGKAALNMMTHTSGASLYQQYRILMNCVRAPPHPYHPFPTFPLLRRACPWLPRARRCWLSDRLRLCAAQVDTGWVTDMAPGGVGVMAQTHQTWMGTPLDEVDGAARVLDPVFSHCHDPNWLVRARCFRNYFVAGW